MTDAATGREEAGGEAKFLREVVEILALGNRPVYHAGDSRKQVRIPCGGYRLVGDELARGYPDITAAVTDSETIWAELKVPGGRLEPDQVKWLDRLPFHRTYVWLPADRDEIIRIKEIGHFGSRRTCWTCNRDGIIGRVGIRRKRASGAQPQAPELSLKPARGRPRGKAQRRGR